MSCKNSERPLSNWSTYTSLQNPHNCAQQNSFISNRPLQALALLTDANEYVYPKFVDKFFARLIADSSRQHISASSFKDDALEMQATPSIVDMIWCQRTKSKAWLCKAETLPCILSNSVMGAHDPLPPRPGPFLARPWTVWPRCGRWWRWGGAGGGRRLPSS
jgi:hypothetical protein